MMMFSWPRCRHCHHDINHLWSLSWQNVHNQVKMFLRGLSVLLVCCTNWITISPSAARLSHPSLLSSRLLLLRPLPQTHSRSQRKRRSINIKTEMYVEKKNLPCAFKVMELEFLTFALCSQRNGYDDEYSVISSRVSSCVEKIVHALFAWYTSFILWLMIFLFLTLSELKTQRWEQSVSLLQIRPHGVCFPFWSLSLLSDCPK